MRTGSSLTEIGIGLALPAALLVVGSPASAQVSSAPPEDLRGLLPDSPQLAAYLGRTYLKDGREARIFSRSGRVGWEMKCPRPDGRARFEEDGTVYSYNRGRLRAETRYHCGEMHGRAIKYHRDSTVAWEIRLYDRGVLRNYTSFWEGGQRRKETTFEGGAPVHVVDYFHPSYGASCPASVTKVQSGRRTTIVYDRDCTEKYRR